MDKKQTIKMLGEAILFSSINFSIGSVEMSSKFSVKNFSKDQETLQNACDSLVDFVKIGLIWTVGVIMLLYGRYGFWGAISGIITNLIIMLWIWFSYMDAFKNVVKSNPALKMPTVRFSNWSIAD